MHRQIRDNPCLPITYMVSLFYPLRWKMLHAALSDTTEQIKKIHSTANHHSAVWPRLRCKQNRKNKRLIGGGKESWSASCWQRRLWCARSGTDYIEEMYRNRNCEGKSKTFDDQTSWAVHLMQNIIHKLNSRIHGRAHHYARGCLR